MRRFPFFLGIASASTNNGYLAVFPVLNASVAAAESNPYSAESAIYKVEVPDPNGW